jgi:AhpD family alkylhydroperoxidase
MKKFTVPTREEVSSTNEVLFDNIKKGLGMVPNLYATFAHSDNALGTYLTLQNAKSSLRAKEREVINLVVSQVNDCRYCQSAHTLFGKLNGFSEDQILEIRGGSVSFDPKLDALARLVKSITKTHGKPDSALVDAFFAAGYTEGNLVDVIIVIGDKIISNYLHGVTQVPIDFPEAPVLESVAV